jgi:hypothetical protein
LDLGALLKVAQYVDMNALCRARPTSRGLGGRADCVLSRAPGMDLIELLA